MNARRVRDNDCDDGAMKYIKRRKGSGRGRANQEEIRPEENMCEGERIKRLGSLSCRGGRGVVKGRRNRKKGEQNDGRIVDTGTDVVNRGVGVVG